MSKENAAACTNKQRKLIETEKRATKNAGDDESEQASITVPSQSTSPEEDCKSQTSKEEEKSKEEERGKDVEEKREDEKMEVDPETAASGDEKGKS